MTASHLLIKTTIENSKLYCKSAFSNQHFNRTWNQHFTPACQIHTAITRYYRSSRMAFHMKKPK